MIYHLNPTCQSYDNHNLTINMDPGRNATKFFVPSCSVCKMFFPTSSALTTHQEIPANLVMTALGPGQIQSLADLKNVSSNVLNLINTEIVMGANSFNVLNIISLETN